MKSVTNQAKHSLMSDFEKLGGTVENRAVQKWAAGDLLMSYDKPLILKVAKYYLRISSDKSFAQFARRFDNFKSAMLVYEEDRVQRAKNRKRIGEWIG